MSLVEEAIPLTVEVISLKGISLLMNLSLATGDNARNVISLVIQRYSSRKKTVLSIRDLL